MKFTEEVAKELYRCLPATSREEIALRLGRRLGVATPSVGEISQLLHRLRIRAEELGWTVPHAVRGIGNEEVEKFFAVSIERDGSFEIDQREALDKGAAGSISYIYRMAKNAAVALNACATQLRPSAYKDALIEWADDFAYQSRKAASLMRKLDAA